MSYDHIIIGSGLAALGAAMAVRPVERLLILAGSPDGQFSYYDDRRSVPCSFSGPGGMGNAWHGVIPLSVTGQLAVDDVAGFADFLNKFYPGSIGSQLGQDRLFVPWAPIRPLAHWKRLSRELQDTITWVSTIAERIEPHGDLAVVHTADGLSFKGRRIWIAAGAASTPFLLERSFGSGIARNFISDHALCYVGLVDDGVAPRVSRHRQGVVFEAFYNDRRDTLYTRRPARFAYRELDFGIEQRAVFGMPTGTVIAKIAKRMSPGLLAEAFYNKAGLFPQTDLYSVYAQRVVEDAYALTDGPLPLTVLQDNIQTTTRLAREQAPFRALTPSRRNDLYIPGIHLHNSIRHGMLQTLGLNQTGSVVNVVDSSAVRDIGPEHHSFRVMFRAYSAVRSSQATA